jgi:hypothetical protein
MRLVAATNLLLDFDIFRYALIHSIFTQETDFHRPAVLGPIPEAQSPHTRSVA